jgi:hypothetical protein
MIISNHNQQSTQGGKRILAVDDEPNVTLTLLSLEETVLFEVDAFNIFTTYFFCLSL